MTQTFSSLEDAGATPKARPFLAGPLEINLRGLGRGGLAEVMGDTTGFYEIYAGKHVLIMGGLGFIGANWARALRKLGARVLGWKPRTDLRTALTKMPGYYRKELPHSL